jgi:hypothetical protein
MVAQSTRVTLLGVSCALLVVGCTTQPNQPGYGLQQPAWSAAQQYLPPKVAAQVPALRQMFPQGGPVYPQTAYPQSPYPQTAYPQSALPQAPLNPYQSPASAYQSPASVYPPSSPSSSSPGGQPSDAELQMRAALLQRSMGFGGIFGPSLKNWMNTPEGNSPGHGQCSDYSDFAACQAHKNGDDWAADRLRNNESSDSERAWYNR